jgi:hypothetical protein
MIFVTTKNGRTKNIFPSFGAVVGSGMDKSQDPGSGMKICNTELNHNYLLIPADVAVQTICSILEQEEGEGVLTSCPRVKLKSRDPPVKLRTGEGMETLPKSRDQDVELKSRDQEMKTSDGETALPESRDPEETESRDQEVRLKSRDQEEGTLLKMEEEGAKKTDRLQQFLNFSLQVIIRIRITVIVVRLIVHCKTNL